MTIVVTGAGGGLGRILMESLGRDSEEVVGLARHARDGLTACDVTDAPALLALVRHVRPRLVFHLVGSFVGDYDVDYRVNALSARNLLDAVHETQCATRVVLMGSAAEYGRVMPTDNPIGEDHVLRPVSVYGMTKAIQTHFAYYYQLARSTDVVVARMFNLLATGLSERLFVGRVERQIRRFIEGAAHTIEVGNLDNSRDYVEADLAVLQLRAIASRGAPGCVYHVAAGMPVTMRELLYRMLDSQGIPRNAVRETAPSSVGRSGFDVPLIYADISRTRALMEAA